MTRRGFLSHRHGDARIELLCACMDRGVKHVSARSQSAAGAPLTPRWPRTHVGRSAVLRVGGSCRLATRNRREDVGSGCAMLRDSGCDPVVLKACQARDAGARRVSLSHRTASYRITIHSRNRRGYIVQGRRRTNKLLSKFFKQKV